MVRISFFQRLVNRCSGQLVVNWGQKLHVVLWDLNNLNSQPHILIERTSMVRTLAFHPQGKWLASGSNDGTAYLWNQMDIGAKPIVLQGLPEHVTDYYGVERLWKLAFDPRGRWLGTASEDAARLWNLQDLATPPIVLMEGTDGALTGMNLTFDSKGHWLAVAGQDGVAQLWNLANPTAIPRVLRGHQSGLPLRLNFDPQGRWLVTGGEEGTVRLWSFHNTDFEPIILGANDDPIRALSIDISDRWLATGSEHGNVNLWDLQIESLLRLACQKAGRNLSKKEWLQYLDEREYRATCPEWLFLAGYCLLNRFIE